ncbi:hypothetical protein E2C01_087295 [Portunus trituberculatus]|uniref:Uncharacterized protein n=1 Tax=Portunus trituberculatus TaxID=210409 RepID=A0A5B7JBI5_PORTR|nr:hypothetical protein [Portunus trituberculatus]
MALSQTTTPSHSHLSSSPTNLHVHISPPVLALPPPLLLILARCSRPFTSSSSSSFSLRPPPRRCLIFCCFLETQCLCIMERNIAFLSLSFSLSLSPTLCSILSSLSSRS